MALFCRSVYFANYVFSLKESTFCTISHFNVCSPQTCSVPDINVTETIYKLARFSFLTDPFGLAQVMLILVVNLHVGGFSGQSGPHTNLRLYIRFSKLVLEEGRRKNVFLKSHVLAIFQSLMKRVQNTCLITLLLHGNISTSSQFINKSLQMAHSAEVMIPKR